MTEYLIRRTDGQWFDIPASRAAEAYRPTSFQFERAEGRGDDRIRCEGVDSSFSYEDAGIQVSIEGDLPERIADQIADEIRQNIEFVSGQKGRVVAL